MDRLIKQWLETDAAFGVTEVPWIPTRQAQPIEPPSITPSPVPTRSIPTPPPAHQLPANAGRPTLSLIPPDDLEGDAAMARKKALDPALFAPPLGKIADLSPLTRAEKEERLSALRQQAERAAAPHINDISTKLVFGEGDADAGILFIGEGPGIEEDKTGRPFVGRSGQLLDKMIAAMGFNRDPQPADGRRGVYIANIVKLRAAMWEELTQRLKDRPPTPEEAARGMPLLHQQIEIIRPLVIVTLGAPAIKYMTGTTEGVMKIRGKWFDYRGIPVMPTFHPSYLLRAYTEENRRTVWNDLQLAMTKLPKKK